jgi:hypothetical protein
MKPSSAKVTAARFRQAEREFAVVLVSRRSMLSDRREFLRLGLAVSLQADVVLASKGPGGLYEFYGERGLAEALTASDPSQFPWDQVAVTVDLVGHSVARSNSA